MSSPGRAHSAPNTVSVATSMNFFITGSASYWALLRAKSASPLQLPADRLALLVELALGHAPLLHPGLMDEANARPTEIGRGEPCSGPVQKPHTPTRGELVEPRQCMRGRPSTSSGRGGARNGSADPVSSQESGGAGRLLPLVLATDGELHRFLRADGVSRAVTSAALVLQLVEGQPRIPTRGSTSSPRGWSMRLFTQASKALHGGSPCGVF